MGQIGKALPSSTVWNRKGQKQYRLQRWQQQNPRDKEARNIGGGWKSFHYFHQIAIDFLNFLFT